MMQPPKVLLQHALAPHHAHALAGLQLRVPVAKGLPPFHKAYDRLLCFATPANLPSLTPTLDTVGLRLSSVTDREHRGAASLEIFSNLFRRREEHEQGGSPSKFAKWDQKGNGKGHRGRDG